MIDIKNPNELKKMADGGKILGVVLNLIIKNIRPGVSEIELDILAEKEIIKRGGEPGFKKVEGYNYTICVSTNDAVVHGIPTNYKLKKGDVIGIDCGVYYEGFHTDMAETVKVGNTETSDEIDKFLEIGKKALLEGMKVAKVGNRVGDISKAVQNIVEGSGYSIVRTLVGHGVGKELHEEPQVPGFLDKNIKQTPLLREGMTITVEIIYNRGKKEVVLAPDRWTIKTKDKSVSGLFERSIAITKNGPVILTPLVDKEQAYLL